MTIADKMLLLKTIAPFDRLRDSELTLLCSGLVERDYTPGADVFSDDHPLRRLCIVVDGTLIGPEGRTLPPVIGFAALMLGRPLSGPVRAGDGGARCLLLSRGNLFTAANECPNLLVGFHELWASDPSSIC